MRKIILKKYIFYIFLFTTLLFSERTLSQENDKESVLSILEVMERQHEVRFSYASNEVEEIFLIPPATALSLEDKIDYLTEKTRLKFDFIDERYISITQGEPERITVCGTILHPIDFEPILGATIQVGNSTKATLSDTDGKFSLEDIPENETIIIRYLGFKEVAVEASLLSSSYSCKTIYLLEDIGQLEEVVLDYIFAKGINKAPDATFKLNIENIGILPGLSEPDVLQMVQVLPGVTSVDETISNINIRGGTNDENLILWDDIRMYQTGHFFGLISAFNPYLTNNVTLYKNGTNARYGESVSGVISMISSNEIPTEFSGGVNLNFINLGAFFKIPVSEKLGIELSARRSITDFVKTPAYNQFQKRIFQDTEITSQDDLPPSELIVSNEDFSFYDISLKTIYQLNERDRLTLNVLTIDNSLNFTQFYNDSEEPITSTLDQRSLAGGLSWKREWNPRFTTKSLLYGTYYLLDATNLDVLSSQELLQTNEVIESGAKIDAKYIFSDKLDLDFGYQFTEAGISNVQDVNVPRYRNFIKEVLITHAAFIQGSLKLNDSRTNIAGGLRLNYMPKFSKFLPEPRLVVHHDLSNGFAVELAGEIKSQTVTQRIDSQNDFLGIEKRRWVLSNNEEVPVLTSEQVSLGFLYKKNNWLINIEGFLKAVEGITTSNQAFQNQFQFVSTTGSYNAKGAELVINKKTRNWSNWFSYTYLKNDFTFEELDPSVFPHNLDIRHQVSTGVTYSLNRFKIATGFNWHAGRPFTEPVEGNPIVIANGVPQINFGEPNDKRLEDYSRIDISGEYSFKVSNKVEGKVNIALLNVLNRKNTLNTYYVLETTPEGVTFVNKVEHISLGMTPNVSLQVLF